MRLEPDKPVDKNEKWGAFGYIVHELTDDVPKAMKDSHIEEVSFKRYVWLWPYYSQPGFYAAVNREDFGWMLL